MFGFFPYTSDVDAKIFLIYPEYIYALHFEASDNFLPGFLVHWYTGVFFEKQDEQ